MAQFTSQFASDITGMLEARATLGYLKEPYETILENFDSYCVKSGVKDDCLTQEIIFPWLLQSRTGTIQKRSSAIRFLARYIELNGREAYILPANYFETNSSHSNIQILTDEQIAALFCSIDLLPESKKVKYSNLILPVLLRLIYTCGLRPGEGCKLKRQYIDFSSGKIKIVETKKKKERFVVMSDDMRLLAVCYDKMRQFFYKDNPYFFPSSDAEPIDEKWLNYQLNKAWEKANPDVQPDHLCKIRVYDLRHRYASANINRWLDEGKDMTAMLPVLRASMGHHSLKETEEYIHLMPENLVKNKGIDWNSFSDIIPEV
jgi:integrase